MPSFFDKTVVGEDFPKMIKVAEYESFDRYLGPGTAYFYHVVRSEEEERLVLDSMDHGGADA
jgi:hypothetical protein